MTEEDMGQEQIMGSPSDLLELYMMARAETFTISNFNKLYFKILFLIDIGKEMLPPTPECTELRKSVVALLEDLKSYPSASQMEHTTEGNYRISTGRQDTGLIEVREADLEQGRDEAREQKATQLLPRLKRMDSKIFEKLVQYGIIEVRKPLLEDLMKEQVMSEIQSGASAVVGNTEEDENEEVEESTKTSETKTPTK